MLVFEKTDPRTGKRTRIVVEVRSSGINLRREKASITDPSQLTARESEVRAAFEEGAYNAYGLKSTDGTPPAWPTIRKAMKEYRQNLPDVERKIGREARERTQQELWDLLPPGVQDVLLNFGGEGAAPSHRKRRRRRASATDRTVDEVPPLKELESIPPPPLY